jgi:hypothetical protein
MSETASIHSMFMREDAKRFNILERARQCAALTRPWILPEIGQVEGNKMPETFTSIPSRGISNLEGRLLMALYPPGTSFFRLLPASHIRFSQNVDTKQVQAFTQALSIQELLMMARLESADMGAGSNRRRTGFRSRKRQAITQILVTGDVLEQFTDDYRLRVFRRDQYVTCRDSSQDVKFHIVSEKIDPAILPPEIMSIADIGADDIERSYDERGVDLYTRCAWQPYSRVWLVEQEINKKIIRTSEEPVTPYMSTPFELAPGEDYGRGFIESNLGDVRTLNELHERLLDFAGMCSKFVPCIDYNSQVRASDLAKPSGEVIEARVAAGAVQDIAFLSVNKSSDFQVVYQTAVEKRRDLAVAMLMEADAAPKGERVTAFQIQRIASELEGALGGVYAPIADAQQVPLVERLLYQMQRDALIPSLPRNSMDIEAVTGIAALSREADKAKLLQLVATVAQFGQEMTKRIDLGVLFDTLLRQSGIFEPGLIKTNDQVAAEASAAMQQAVEMEAQKKLIQVGGDVMTNELSPQETSNAGTGNAAA